MDNNKFEWRRCSRCKIDESSKWLLRWGTETMVGVSWFEKDRGKNELVERVSLSVGIIKVDPKIDGGKWFELKKGGVTKDTDVTLPIDGARNFPSRNIPSMFNCGHLYFYLVESIQPNHQDSDTEDISTDTVTARPLKKGQNLFASNFVENVQDNLLPNGDYLLRSHVHHSMKKLVPLNVTVIKLSKWRH